MPTVWTRPRPRGEPAEMLSAAWLKRRAWLSRLSDPRPLPWACSHQGAWVPRWEDPAGPRIESPKLELARWTPHGMELLQNQGSSQPLVISRTA